MTAIIFGASGQDGIYLTELLEGLGYLVVGVSRTKDGYIQGDISDKNFVTELIRSYIPDFVFNFAATSSTSHSFLYDNHNCIVRGTINILESCFQFSRQSKVFITGSALQFRNLNLPISESTPYEARDSYSSARIASCYYARYYRSLGLKVYIGYLFHHESPLRGSQHLSKRVINGIKEIKNGRSNLLEIGNLNICKEWGYAKDIVSGIYTLVNQDDIFEACIGTGISHPISEWVRLAFDKASLDYNAYIKETGIYRNEFNDLYSDPSVIMSLGWKPTVDIKELVDLMYST